VALASRTIRNGVKEFELIVAAEVGELVAAWLVPLDLVDDKAPA
jgi:hypothetical protein